MKIERNRRGFTEHIFEGQHLKLPELKRKTRYEGLESKYLFKEIAEYPKPEFHVSRLKHDTSEDGLKGIRKDGGFRDPYGGSLVWWSLTVGPEELKDAEMRLLEKTFPDRMEVEDPEQQSFLWKFATSPAFKETSRLGCYRFTFSLEEVLTAYREQFCSGAQPVMRIYKTVLYSQEVMHVVLVHSPANKREFSQFPSLSLDPNAVCVFSDGCFIWRPEAMCGTHGYELVYRHQTRQMETWTCSPQFYVWDHVAVALHVGPKVLKFNVDQLRTKLKFCQQDEVSYGQNFGNPDGFAGAKAEVKKLWPGWTGLLEIERSLKHSLTVTDIQLVLVGWPGVGKSSSGNTILGRTAFSTSSAADSQLSGGTQCCLQRGTIFSREVTIIDTPGLSGRFSPDLKKEILRCINLWSPVPHAILLVARLGFFPTNVKKTVKQMERMFGENVWSRTMILLTHHDQAEPDVKTQLQECKAKLKEPFLKKVCLVLNISPECKDLQQIWDLLHEATKLVSEQKSVSRMQ